MTRSPARRFEHARTKMNQEATRTISRCSLPNGHQHTRLSRQPFGRILDRRASSSS
jgi:hypothetical protein